MRHVLWNAVFARQFFREIKKPGQGLLSDFHESIASGLEATRAHNLGSGVETLLWNDRSR